MLRLFVSFCPKFVNVELSTQCRVSQIDSSRFRYDTTSQSTTSVHSRTPMRNAQCAMCNVQYAGQYTFGNGQCAAHKVSTGSAEAQNKAICPSVRKTDALSLAFAFNPTQLIPLAFAFNPMPLLLHFLGSDIEKLRGHF
jgi:hypothetical protein